MAARESTLQLWDWWIVSVGQKTPLGKMCYKRKSGFKRLFFFLYKINIFSTLVMPTADVNYTRIIDSGEGESFNSTLDQGEGGSSSWVSMTLSVFPPALNVTHLIIHLRFHL